MSAIAERVAGRYTAARSDAALLQAALHVEEVVALAYTAAADGPLEAGERTRALAFAEQEREHARALESMLLGLTVPVRRHAVQADLDALAPGLRAGSRVAALDALAQLEGAAIAGQQQLARRLTALDVLRTVAMVMAGGAQHLVVLRDALGQLPVTQTFESG